MKYIIIEASGRQYWVEAGKFIDMNHLSIQSGSKISLHRVFFGKDGNNIYIGQPYLPHIKVEASIKKHFLGPKVIVYKMKPKKKYRRKNGHRQELTRVMIEKITF